MAAKASKNPYEGKVTICVDGRPAEEVGKTYIQAIVTDWFTHAMFRTQMNKPGFEYLSKWEYLGMDCEQFRKGEQDV